MSLLLPISESYHGLLQPDFLQQRMFSESESSIANDNSLCSVPELTCKNYRKLPWDMPVDTPENSNVDRDFEQITNEVIKPQKRTLPVRNDNYFRSIYAIHFCHKPDLLRDYNVRGVRERDLRRRRLLGDDYYCINHPPHYRLLEARLKNEFDMTEDAKAHARKVDTFTLNKQENKELDPVLNLPSASDLGRGDIVISKRIRIAKLPLNSTSLFSSEDTLEQVVVNPSPVQSVRKLYKQAKAILEHIHPPADGPDEGFLRTMYARNNLATFEAYEDMSETSETAKAAMIPDSTAEVAEQAPDAKESRRGRSRKMF